MIACPRHLQRHVVLLLWLQYVSLLGWVVPPTASLSSVPLPPRPVLRTLTLVDGHAPPPAGIGLDILARAQELQALPEELTSAELEDELEILYPTLYQYFEFFSGAQDSTLDEDAAATIRIRSTSFGCGKLGHQVWPSSLALSMYLVHKFAANPSMPNVLELGAGCGLPSIVCDCVLKATSVTATDFWYTDADATFDKDRLIPTFWHGINLQYNLNQGQSDNDNNKRAVAKRLDWHDPTSLQACMMDIPTTTENDLVVIGSDLIYYPMDLDPLWETLMSLLSEYGATQIVLVCPMVQETREALPAFLERAESNAQGENALYTLQRQPLTLYKYQDDLEVRQNGDCFVALTLTNTKQPT